MQQSSELLITVLLPSQKPHEFPQGPRVHAAFGKHPPRRVRTGSADESSVGWWSWHWSVDESSDSKLPVWPLATFYSSPNLLRGLSDKLNPWAPGLTKKARIASKSLCCGCGDFPCSGTLSFFPVHGDGDWSPVQEGLTNSTMPHMPVSSGLAGQPVQLVSTRWRQLQ